MSEVQTLARGLQIIELLADVEGGLTTTELTEQLATDKSGISRLMNTLVKYRFADRDSQTRRYYLGSHLHELSRRAGQHAELRELVMPHLEQLGQLTHENAHAAVHASGQALTIADVPSTEPLRVVSEVGRRMPLHCSAVGKCLLAFAQFSHPATYPQFTEKTITNTARFERELDQIRRNGHALDDEELTLGVRGLAVPVRNREGRAVATIGLSGPTVRLTDALLPHFVSLLHENGRRRFRSIGVLPAEKT